MPKSTTKRTRRSPPTVRKGLPSIIRDRLRDLRLALGFSQAEIAAGSGGRLDRIAVLRIEGGGSKLQSHRARTGLAAGLRLPVDRLDDLIAGTLSLEDAQRIAVKALRAEGIVAPRAIRHGADGAPGSRRMQPERASS